MIMQDLVAVFNQVRDQIMKSSMIDSVYKDVVIKRMDRIMAEFNSLK